jgi:hypothetical protein
MQKTTRPALALLAFMGLMFAQTASGQAQDWPWLGVIITDISSGNIEEYKADGAGSYVTGIEHAGPASDAGLIRHDIIIAVDSRSALNTRELTCLIQGRRPGDVVSVTVMRAGQRQSMPATLGRWPPSKEFPRPAIGNCGKEPVSSVRAPRSACAGTIGFPPAHDRDSGECRHTEDNGKERQFAHHRMAMGCADVEVDEGNDKPRQDEPARPGRRCAAEH